MYLLLASPAQPTSGRPLAPTLESNLSLRLGGSSFHRFINIKCSFSLNTLVQSEDGLVCTLVKWIAVVLSPGTYSNAPAALPLWPWQIAMALLVSALRRRMKHDTALVTVKSQTRAGSCLRMLRGLQDFQGTTMIVILLSTRYSASVAGGYPMSPSSKPLRTRQRVQWTHLRLCPGASQGYPLNWDQVSRSQSPPKHGS